LAADYLSFSALGFPQFTSFFDRTYIRKLRYHSEPLYQLSYQGMNFQKRGDSLNQKSGAANKKMRI